tara:strand:+ start:1915 stop:2142 length:228 start_codon:yes stop_codon:yes gene_type:complete
MKIMSGNREVNLNDYSNEQLQVLIKGLCKKIVKLEKENRLFKLPTPKLGNIESKFMEDKINDEFTDDSSFYHYYP